MHEAGVHGFMGDGRLNRAIEQGKARTSEIKARVPELKERVPELKERVPELGTSAELRTKGTELRTRGGELARHYAKIDVSWARCGYARALREALLQLRARPDDRLLPAPPRGRAARSSTTLTPPVIFVANHSSHLDTPTILRAMPRKWRNRTAVAAAADYFYKTAAGRPTASRCCSTPSRSAATAAGSATARPTTSTG